MAASSGRETEKRERKPTTCRMSSFLVDKQAHGRAEWLQRKGMRRPRVSRKLCPGFGQPPKDKERKIEEGKPNFLGGSAALQGGYSTSIHLRRQGHVSLRG